MPTGACFKMLTNIQSCGCAWVPMGYGIHFLAREKLDHSPWVLMG